MRSRSLLVTLSLVAGGLGALAGATAPSTAAGELLERWCVDAATSEPCVESARHNGVPMAASTGPYRVQLSDVQSLDYTDWIAWQVVDSSGARTLPVGDTWSVTIDMGTMKPRYTEGYGDAVDVQRSTDGDGTTYHVTITGTSVRMAESCNDTYPPVCNNPTPGTSVSGTFSGEVQDLDRDTPDAGDASWRNGYDRFQNLDGVSDPFFEPTAGGGYLLTFDTYNAARYTDVFDDDGSSATTTLPFVGSFGMHLPYNLMRKRFGVPDPDTMPLSSFGVSTTGDGSAGAWSITRDGSAFDITVHNVTYPDTVAGRTNARTASKTQVRTLRVKRGAITPYAPKGLGAKRVAAGRARITYAAAKARGARPTGYTVRCTNLARTHTVTLNDAASPTVVTGLRAGKAYDCQVRARSKAGPGAWSVKVRVPARP